MKEHLTTRELLEYVDGSIDPPRRDEIDRHIHKCPDCQAWIRGDKELERTLRRIPLEHPAAQFTGRVMNRIGIAEMPSFAWIVVKNLAPLVALVIVGGIVVAVLAGTGALQSTQVQQSLVTGQSMYSGIVGKLSGGIAEMNMLIQKYLSFAFAKNVYALTTFLICFFGAIGLLDKFIFSPMMKRKAG